MQQARTASINIAAIWMALRPRQNELYFLLMFHSTTNPVLGTMPSIRSER
jgi:hypothetical protein